MTSLDPDVSMPDEMMALFSPEEELAEIESGERPRTNDERPAERGTGEDRVIGTTGTTGYVPSPS
jgi:hypothetical protein